MANANLNLLDPAFLRRLEKLRIQTRRAFPGTMRGERRSTRKGSSVEFADFRKYESGDDFRHVDWNIYARMERLMLRQFVEEEDVRIDILIDQSRSMQFGEPHTKFDFARKAAAALAFLAVNSLDRVGVTVFDSAIRSRARAMRGRGQLLALLAFLNSLEAGQDDGLSGSSAAPHDQATGSESGASSDSSRDSRASNATDLGAVLRSYRRITAQPGVLIIISDFFDPRDFRREMKLLVRQRFDLDLIQVLTPDELRPKVVGAVDLVDCETGERREVTVNARTIAAYRSVLERFTSSLETFSRTNGIGYTLVTADQSFEELLIRNLVESRMVR
ncbi:MAG TPA: DUF58 domain-containing protein [Blastocatellia bacterium]|nr:DUF58 domain-containing protein [Blastocatellia bacterium]